MNKIVGEIKEAITKLIAKKAVVNRQGLAWAHLLLMASEVNRLRKWVSCNAWVTKKVKNKKMKVAFPNDSSNTWL